VEKLSTEKQGFWGCIPPQKQGFPQRLFFHVLILSTFWKKGQWTTSFCPHFDIFTVDNPLFDTLYQLIITLSQKGKSPKIKALPRGNARIFMQNRFCFYF
jgi:hypothetical protein